MNCIQILDNSNAVLGFNFLDVITILQMERASFLQI